MTNASNEPTLTDVMQSIAQLSQNVEQVSHRVDKLSQDFDEFKTEFDGLKTEFDGLKTEFDGLKTDVEKFNDRFSNYQQANQWVVQLAFTLIASATITIIVTSILKR